MLQEISIPAGQLAVWTEGSGPPVLLVHGYPLDHSMWDFQTSFLRDNYRTIAPDLRGFGKSPSSGDSVTMAEFADDLASVLDGLEIQRPVAVICLSMGGYITLEFWRRHARRIAGIAFCDTRAKNDPPEVAKARGVQASQVLREGTASVVESMSGKLFAEATHGAHPERIMQTRLAMEMASPAGVAAAARGMAVRADFTPLIPQLPKLPCVAICGVEDRITPLAEMEAFAALIPGCPLHAISAAGHMAPLENPTEVNHILDGFLKEIFPHAHA